MAKNLNTEHEKQKTIEDRISDTVTDFAGSLKFVYVHTVWFAIWIVVNIGIFAFGAKFDPYPFGLLTLIVSLEAIFLSTFVMISQNRQAKREEIRAQLDYETDVKAEQEISGIKSTLEELAKKQGIKIKE
jgi:uncharacterized membrane protein